MSDLLKRIQKNSRIKESDILSKSIFFNEKDIITTDIPAVNIALSGSIDGGLTPGLTVFAGPSKHFKTAFLMLLIKSHQRKYEDSVTIFYDSEFGAPHSYFESFEIDMDRIIHCPITDLEQLKFDAANQLKEIERGDHVFIAIDSVGNLASKKEVEDALDEKSVADMTRAKAMKSLFRIITPHLTLKDIPAVVVNHTYKEIGLFPKDVVSGGTGIYYSADNIYIIGRRQEKQGTEISGYNFIINVEKSRFVKEKSKIPVEVTWENGINQWSGLLEMGLASGFVTKPIQGWYCKKGSEAKHRLKDTNNEEFWKDIIENRDFLEWIEKKYTIDSNSSIIDFETGEILDEEVL